MVEINIISLNQELPNTCGSCRHTDNELGFVSLRCALIYAEMEADEEHDAEWYDFAKVRSWHECHYKPSKYEPRLSAQKVKKEC